MTSAPSLLTSKNYIFIFFPVINLINVDMSKILNFFGLID